MCWLGSCVAGRGNRALIGSVGTSLLVGSLRPAWQPGDATGDQFGQHHQSHPSLHEPVMRSRASIEAVTADAYDAIAEAYDADVVDSILHRVSIPSLVKACGPGERLLDLACGQGVLARALAGEGRTVIGVDSSRRLLEIAARRESDRPLGIRYCRDDARTLASLEDGSFDGVASNLALGDIDDLGAMFRAVARVLRPGGWFAFAALHPCFCPPRRATVQVDGGTALQVGRYFDEGPHRRSQHTRPFAGMEWHHRTLSTIWRELGAAGLVVKELTEPYPPGDVAAAAPIYGEIAMVLVVLALKPART